MSRYPDDWNERRRQVKIRDGFRCIHCGVRGGPGSDITLQVHHVRPVSDGGGHAATNLATLCPACHHRFHDR